MNENEEQLSEIFGGFWKKFIAKQKKFNVQQSQPVEPPTVTLPSGRRTRRKSPEQLMLPLKRKKRQQLKLPMDIPKNPEPFDMDKVYTDIAKAWQKAANMKAAEEKKERDLKKIHRHLKKTGKTLDDFGLSELTSMINEVVSEELNEINHTTDSSGKTIIAQGAPGSVVRFATEHPDVIKAMKDWIKDCSWADLPDDEAVDELSDEEVLRGVQNNYEGGIRAFIRDSNSKAEVPIGYKESLKENWSSGQFDDEPDGYSNDAQRAFAHSQATTPRENQRPKAIELAKQGKYVLLVSNPVYCKSTDAVLGCSQIIHGVYDTHEKAAEEGQKLYKSGHEDGLEVIGPEDVKEKPTQATPPEDDVPFQEGVGYVHDKDMKKDPKHIPGERWRIKFQSDSDLKKHGNTETSPVDEVNEKPDYYQQLQYAHNAASRAENAEAMIYYSELMGRPNGAASVSFERFKGSHLYPKWKAENQEKIDLQQKRFRMPWLQETISKNDLKDVIKELVTEMWYGSKNDVEGDETHDEPMNEILGSYDKMIEFVKSLPKEEQEKLNQMSKEMGASAAVIKYLEDLSAQEPQEPKEPMNESSDWNPQPLPQDAHKIAEIIHSLKEGMGVFFSYDNVTGHSSDWIWIECVSDGETISYHMKSKGNSGSITDLEDDSMIDDVAKEIATGGYHFFAIQPIQNYRKPPRHYPEDDQDVGEYERHDGPFYPEPQFEVAPPGFEGTVKAMKKHKEIDNPWALAWSMKNKGYKSHKK